MNRITSKTAALLLLVTSALTSVAGCDEGDDGMVGGKAYPPAGSTVHVQFRRDYLGYATSGGGPGGGTNSPLIGAMGEGAPQPVAAGGELRRVTDDFVVIGIPGSTPPRELWVPREAVLMLDVTRPAQK